MIDGKEVRKIDKIKEIKRQTERDSSRSSMLSKEPPDTALLKINRLT
jgi:hypothetical protein